MTKSISINSNEQLKLKIKKATEARKVVRKKLNDLFHQTWDLKSGKNRLDWLISEAKEELGRRKALKCKAMQEVKTNGWSGTYPHWSCLARELSYNYFREPQDLYRKYCCTCRWKPAQAQTRMVILRIKNGRKGDAK